MATSSSSSSSGAAALPSPSDLELPVATIVKLVRDAIPGGMILTKDTKTALQRAASIFLLYIASSYVPAHLS